MAFRIRLVDAPPALEALQRLRHRVFVEEEGQLAPTPDSRIRDRFDGLPTTANVVAAVDGRIVGGMRYMAPGSAGLSTDDFFDFRDHLPSGRVRVGAMGMQCVSRRVRGTPRLTFSLVGMGLLWAIQQGLTHLLCVANPAREAAFTQAGYRKVAPTFWHPVKAIPCVPMVLDLEDLEPRLVHFVRRQARHPYVETFEREFLAPGDVLAAAGDGAGCRLVILDGTVRARGTQREWGPGDALMPQPGADLVALTAVDLLVLDSVDAPTAARGGAPARVPNPEGLRSAP